MARTRPCRSPRKRVALSRLGFAVGDVVKLEYPILLLLEVRSLEPLQILINERPAS